MRWWRAQVAANSAACRAGEGGAARSVRSSAPENRCGTTALTTTSESSRPSCSRSRARSSSVSATGISSAVDTASTAVSSRVGEEARHRAALLGDRADARDRRKRARRLQHRQTVPGRRSVEHDQVVGPRAAGAPLGLGQLPDLADRQQLAHARRRRGQRREDPAARQQRGQRARSAAAGAGTPPSRAAGRSRCGAADRRPLARRTRPPRPTRPARARGRHGPPPRPRSCAARAGSAASPNAAATVDFPTPPLPVTTSKRVGEQSIHRSWTRVVTQTRGYITATDGRADLPGQGASRFPLLGQAPRSRPSEALNTAGPPWLVTCAP